jgi:hypothetical protein
MITFCEYSYNLDQVIKLIQDMRHDMRDVSDHSRSKAKNHVSIIQGYVPVDFLDKLPDTARADIAIVLADAVKNDHDSWNEVGRHLHVLWDQPVPMPGKTLGGELLNRVSAEVMESIGAEFFISFSGNLSKGIVYKYTHKHPRVFPSKKNYRWGAYSKVVSAISGDYTAHFNNHREIQ